MSSGAKVPFNDLERQTVALAAEIEAAIRTVLASGWFILGPQVEGFEAEFAACCGTAHCVGTGNGTDALELALRALAIGPGDQVATVANAGGYSTAAIVSAGAEPLYVDVDRDTMTMDPGALGAAMGPRVHAVIATHLYGRMAAMPAILEAAAGTPVVEDCAQAHGARRNGRPAGSWGTLGCFSFYPTKNLGALGDGGAVVTGDAGLAARVRSLGQYGWSGKYRSALAGGRNSRLDEIQAAVLRVKLPRLAGWNRRRLQIAGDYNRALAGCALVTPLVTPDMSDDWVAHLYVVRCQDRDGLREALRARGIGTDVHYPIPDHLQESSRWKSDLPVTVACCREVLSLPCFPELTDEEVVLVAQATRSATV
jgi:dTDP-4-amino-4,6-dideoxygalactose transaminase